MSTQPAQWQAQAGTSPAADVVSSPTNTAGLESGQRHLSLIKYLSAVNTDSVDRTLKIFYDPAGSNFDDTTIIYQKTLAAGEHDQLPVYWKIEPGGKVRTSADAADVVNVTFFGDRMTH